MTLFTRMYSSLFTKNKCIWRANSFQQLCRHYSSFIGSKVYNPEEKIDFDVSKSPEEWKYVMRLLPVKYIPEPVHKDNFPSGWKPPRSDAKEGAYFVQRSRNHMIPVYLKITQRGSRKLTYVRHIFGDIWLFSYELKKYIEEKDKKEIGMKVDEVGCKVVLHGDHVYYVEQFILEKGM